MADYKRVVSYMYNYEDHVKHNNIGFTRIETKNGQCKITLHMKVLSLNEQEIGTYIFHRHNGDIRCLHLGEMMVKNGVGDLRIVTKTDNIMDSGYSLNEMGGIVVYASQNKYFGTEWDDNPIILKKLNLLTKRADFEKRVSFKEEAKENSSERNKEELKAASQEELKMEYHFVEDYETVSSYDDNKDNDDMKQNDIESEEIIVVNAANKPEDAELDASDKARQETSGPVLEYPNMSSADIRNSRAVIECLGDFKSCESEEESKEIQKEIQVLKARIQQLSKLTKEWEEKQKQIKAQNLIKQALPQTDPVLNKQADNVAQRILMRFPQMRPFEDGEITDCVRIEPQDIGSFPMQAWILANNSFLLHGYYSYKHLIFAKRRRGRGFQYILGVPGINHNRERFIAKMFGFEQFKGIKNKELEEGEFGYWYLEVAL